MLERFNSKENLLWIFQRLITPNWKLTPQILRSLGAMYAAGGEMTENIDSVGGEGTGAFAQQAIEIYCK